MLVKVIAAAVAAFGQITPSAQELQPPSSFHPNWAEKPKAEDVARAYPEQARSKGLAGHALMHCFVNADGTLRDCTVAPDAEAPAGLGFGAAVLSLAPVFRMTKPDAAGNEIDIPVSFQTNTSGPAPLSPLEERRALDRIKAALDPSVTPPLIEPAFRPAQRGFASLAPIGGYFPERAQRLGLAGVAVIRCVVAADHGLGACERLAAVPTGVSFDDAALRMAKDGYMRAPDDVTAGTTVRVIVKFPKP